MSSRDRLKKLLEQVRMTDEALAEELDKEIQRQIGLSGAYLEAAKETIRSLKEHLEEIQRSSGEKK